jgi:hypothetical protein
VYSKNHPSVAVVCNPVTVSVTVTDAVPLAVA